jgi:hypothetical protein
MHKALKDLAQSLSMIRIESVELMIDSLSSLSTLKLSYAQEVFIKEFKNVVFTGLKNCSKENIHNG